MPILVKIDGLDGHGDSKLDGYDKGDWFIADSFSFGIEREMKESGEKGGTQDINIGVGELQECTISKSMDSASALLAQYAVNGNSTGGAQFDFVQTGGDEPFVYLRYKLDRCFVKSWSTGGDALGSPRRVPAPLRRSSDTLRSSARVLRLSASVIFPASDSGAEGTRDLLVELRPVPLADEAVGSRFVDRGLQDLVVARREEEDADAISRAGELQIL